jgi:hypothetical protein
MLIFATTASALIKIDFTPIDLVKDSDVIVLLELTKVDDKGVAHAKVTKIVKGEMTAKEITVDLEASELSKVAGAKMKDFMTQGQKEALLFVGRFELNKDAGGGGGEPEVAGFLHMAGEWTDNNQNEWFVLNSVPDSGNAKWDMSKFDSELLGVWNGSTDMLLRCVEYIKGEEKPIVPCLANANWAEESLVAKLTGKVFAAKGVDLTGKSATGQGDLFIAADSGDKVYRYASGKMGDITEKIKLTSKSQKFVFGDFNGDGTLDLLSFDGKGLALYTQAADGTFAAAKACDAGDALAGGVVSMATVDVGAKGKPGVVIGTKGWPLLATLADDGKVTTKVLGTGEFAKDAGEASQCLVADFDNDGIVDVVQLCAKGGYFYKGKAAGEFAAAAPTQIACGEGRNAAALGDFDADGLQDIMVVAEDRNRLWHNLGSGKFVNMLVGSGEIFYHPKAGGIAVDTADFNNDMRTDVLILYGIEQKPHIFFNRGFRSFGQAYSVDLDELNKLDQAREGQQAGCLGEFTGDGAIDQVLVLKNGEVWFFPRKVENAPDRAVVAAVALGGPTAGPVTVCASKDDLPFGSQVVRAGDPGTLFGMPDVGPVLLTWKTPDGKQHEQVVVVEAKNRLVRVTLQADAK